MANTPVWSKRVQKKMIDKGINRKQLAEELKVNYTQLCNILTGYAYNEKIIKAICAYFEMEV